MKYHFPGIMTFDQIKVWTKNHFFYVGTYTFGKKSGDNWGGGSYILKGNRYQENILYDVNKKYIGIKINMLFEIKNDTLIQTWHVNDAGQIDKSKYHIEKYIRAE